MAKKHAGQVLGPAPPAQVRTLALPIRLGAVFQDRVLADFHSTAAPSFLGIPCPSPASLWLTPALPVALSEGQVANLLSFHFTAPPVRLPVQRAADFIFEVTIASANVATIIYLAGPFGRDKFKLSPHLTWRCTALEVDKLASAFTAPAPAAGYFGDPVVPPIVPSPLTAAHASETTAPEEISAGRSRCQSSLGRRPPYPLVLPFPSNPSLPLYFLSLSAMRHRATTSAPLTT